MIVFTVFALAGPVVLAARGFHANPSEYALRQGPSRNLRQAPAPGSGSGQALPSSTWEPWLQASANVSEFTISDLRQSNATDMVEAMGQLESSYSNSATEYSMSTAPNGVMLWSKPAAPEPSSLWYAPENLVINNMESRCQVSGSHVGGIPLQVLADQDYSSCSCLSDADLVNPKGYSLQAHQVSPASISSISGFSFCAALPCPVSADRDWEWV